MDEEWQRVRRNSQDTGASAWWNGNFIEPQGKLDVVELQIVDIFKLHTSHGYFQLQSHYRLDS